MPEQRSSRHDAYKEISELAEYARAILAAGNATKEQEWLYRRLSSMERTLGDLYVLELAAQGLGQSAPLHAPAADGTTGPLPRVQGGAHRAARKPKPKTPPERRHLFAMKDDGLRDAGMLALIAFALERAASAAGSAVSRHVPHTAAAVTLIGAGGGLAMASAGHQASTLPYTTGVTIQPAAATPSDPGTVTIPVPAPKGKHHRPRRPATVVPVKPSPRTAPRPSPSATLPAQGTLTVSSQAVTLVAGRAEVTLTAEGGPVRWWADGGSQLVLDTSSGILAAGQAVTITVTMTVPGAVLQPGSQVTIWQAAGPEITVSVRQAAPAPAPVASPAVPASSASPAPVPSH